jgi:hypothetical protein
MVCIPEIIINYSYYKEVDRFCEYANTHGCQLYKNTTESWLSSMNYDHIRFYKLNLIDLIGVETAERMVVDFSMINCLAMTVIFLLNLIAISNVSTLVLEIDFLLTTPADFTLMVSNLPSTITKDELTEIFNFVKGF